MKDVVFLNDGTLETKLKHGETYTMLSEIPTPTGVVCEIVDLNGDNVESIDFMGEKIVPLYPNKYFIDLKEFQNFENNMDINEYLRNKGG